MCVFPADSNKFSTFCQHRWHSHEAVTFPTIAANPASRDTVATLLSYDFFVSRNGRPLLVGLWVSCGAPSHPVPEWTEFPLIRWFLVLHFCVHQNNIHCRTNAELVHCLSVVASSSYLCRLGFESFLFRVTKPVVSSQSVRTMECRARSIFKCLRRQLGNTIPFSMWFVCWPT